MFDAYSTCLKFIKDVLIGFPSWGVMYVHHCLDGIIVNVASDNELPPALLH